jgi:hypothetical protein
MDHYVAYHSVRIMGHDYSPEDRFDYRSSKPEGFLRSSLGALVWLIVGCREAKRTEYRLAGVYTPTSVREVADGRMVEGWGTPLRPAPILTDLSWFPEFLRAQANFSLGFNRLTDAHSIQAFSELVAVAQHTRVDEAFNGTVPELAFDPDSVVDARQRVMASIVRRRGQPAFRAALLKAYGSICAFSDCAVETILDAAHIVPYRGVDTNDVRNGLLLRTDLHALFDLGLLAVDSETMKILASPILAGSEYAQFAGRALRLPLNSEHSPSEAALEHHRVKAGLT